MADPKQERELLPANVVPTHYDITLEPNFEKLTFDGSTTIDLDVVETSSSISLNTLELDNLTAKLLSNGETICASPKIAYDEDKQTTKLDFSASVEKGSKAQVQLTFLGHLNDKMAGFYRSTYKKADGTDGILACSQMEPTDARRAFPCFDEPALKAEFTVTLIADKNLTCLSNMDVKTETEVQSKQTGTPRKAVHFNRSPKMSTYLVAFLVGELNYIECNDFRVPVRVYAPPSETIEHGRYAAELAAKTLAFYEKIFGIDYPLPKLDQIAIPDFAQGAMENWGLVTYRVVCIMFDEKTSGAATRERVAEVVQHELAHQWFGNLVTMDWWEGLWLNEGFATWASWYSCNIFYPEWHVWQTYVVDNLQSALSLDSLRSSHPIEVPVKRADEINQIFDSISYSKGSCILRMVSTYLGEETFLEGVRQYLKKFAYGNATTNDLWESLSAVSGKPVQEMMAAWTQKIGYPVLTVTENQSDNTINVKQNRFLKTGDVKAEDDQILYPVFLGLRTKDGVDGSLALNEREGNFKVPDTEFFKLNANHTGIYRTLYEPARLEKLGEAAKKGLLTVEDRAGMVADARALASSGYLKTSGLLDLLKGFDTETEFVVWQEIITGLGSLQASWNFADKATQESLEKLTKDLVSAKAHQLGWEITDQTGHVEQQFKPLMFGAAGRAGDKTIIAAAQDMFKRFMDGDKSAVHPNMRGGVFSICLKYGGAEEYDKVLNLYRTSKNSDERNSCLRCLGHARQPELIQRTIGLLDSDDVKDQDVYIPTAGLRGHPAGIEALFDFMTKNWDSLYKRFPPALSMLGSLVMIMTSGFTTREQLDKVNKFFEGKNTNGFDQSLAQTKDSIQSKMSWVERDGKDLAAWLSANGY